MQKFKPSNNQQAYKLAPSPDSCLQIFADGFNQTQIFNHSNRIPNQVSCPPPIHHKTKTPINKTFKLESNSCFITRSNIS